jgi:2-methylcitrate dehydratase PrpD
VIADEVAEWVVGTSQTPASVRTAAVRHILDGFGTALAAMRLGVAAPAVTVARGLGGPPEASIIGTNDRISAPAAAFANGTLIHALDFDDTHAGGLIHATAVVLPAALAVGQEQSASGQAVLNAAVLGYEVACRVASAAPNGFHDRGIHATMVAGVFGSAVVASKLMGLDAATLANALGIAGSQAGGLLAFLSTGASTKQLHPGFASHGGILAARLAAAGASGPRNVFDGPHGVFEALAGGELDRGRILRGLGEDWETTQIGIKPYPVCQLSHATIAALQNAMSREEFAASDVIEIRAQVHPASAAIVCPEDRDLIHPSTPYAAKFSMPWSVAALVVDGTLTTETFSIESVARLDVADLAAKVRWDVNQTPKGVAADAPGDVVVTLVGGRSVIGHVDRSDGAEPAPLSMESLVAKFEANVGRAQPLLVEAIVGMESMPNLESILRLSGQAITPMGK